MLSLGIKSTKENAEASNRVKGGWSTAIILYVAKDKVHAHDLQATILHCMDLDHTKLTYRFQGRDDRLTDVHGEVVKGILD